MPQPGFCELPHIEIKQESPALRQPRDPEALEASHRLRVATVAYQVDDGVQACRQFAPSPMLQNMFKPFWNPRCTWRAELQPLWKSHFHLGKM